MRYLILVFAILFNSFVLSGQPNKIDSLKSILMRTQDTTKASINVLLSMEYHSTNVNLAEKYAKEGLALSTKEKYNKGIADALRELGRLNLQKGNYELSLDYHLKSHAIYKTIPNRRQIAKANHSISSIYSQMAEYEKASEYSQIALAQFEEISDKNGIAGVYNNMAIIYETKDDFENAIIYYKKALELYSNSSLKRKYAGTLANFGAVNGVIGNYELGIKTIKEAQKIQIKLNDPFGMAGSWVVLSELYEKSENYEQAIETALKGLTIAQENNYNRWIIKSSMYLARNHAALKNYEKAYQYSQLLNVTKQKTYNEQKARIMTEMETKYQSEKKEQEIVALEQQKQTADFRRNTYLASGLLLVTILFLLYNQQRQKSKKNRLLFEKEHEVAQMKSNFFSNVSHEFRTPLTLILGPIKILKSGIKKAKMDYQLDVMERNANRLLLLINQLLDLAKLEAGSHILSLNESDIVSVIKGVTMSFESKAEVKKIELAVTTDRDYLQVYFDREKIETILINLITNSFNFTPDKGKINVSLEVIEDIQGKEQCKIVVKDSGKGIPNEDIDTIFNRFYQSSNHQDGQYDGSGIGLALTKELVELHKGSISASSKEDEGTEITVMLPLGKAHFSEQELTKVHKKEIPKTNHILIESIGQPDYISTNIPEGSSPILLLIEDNTDVMLYIKEILGDTYQILEAKDGEIGIEVAKEHIPDLIISDVMMPKKNGYEVCDTLKQDEKTSHIPIILLTAKASLEDKMQGLSSKADVYLTKPFVPKELLVRVQNLIESRKKLREKYKKEGILKPKDVTVNSIDEKFLNRLIELVEFNMPNENFGVTQLSLEICMSRSQLHRKLIGLLGQGPNKFIQSYRLQRAHDLLKQKAATASEISYQVGFGSPSYFTKCFHKHFGYTPTEIQNHLS